MKVKNVLMFIAVSMWSAIELSGVARADLINISISNPGSSSFSLTPLWYGFHDGGFDVFDPGATASGALEALAEDGIVSGLQSDFSMFAPLGQQGVLAAPGGFAGAPIIEGGETASFTFNLSSSNRFLSFASMVIPSNDSFIGNPNAIEIFNADGTFVGGGSSRTLTILYENIWDAGTEVNDTLGAAFSLVGGTSTDENGIIGLLPPGGLDNFLNTQTPLGTIDRLFSPGSTVATITITAVPEPSSMALLAMVGTSFVVARRRFKAK